MKYILAILVILGTLFITSLPLEAQTKNDPRNIQCKVVEILEKGKLFVRAKCLSMQNEIVFVSYKGFDARLAVIGSWFTIRGKMNDKEGEKIKTTIRLNR